MAKSKLSANSRFWTLVIVVISLIGMGAATYSAVIADRNIKTSLSERTNGLAALIPAREVNSLKGSDADLASPIYQSLKQRLINVHQANHDIRFAYIMGLRDHGKDAFFYVDSEDPSSYDYSPPGQSYPEGIADVQSIFNTRQSRVLPVERDRWGVWLSGFSPVKNADGSVAGIFGLDIPAHVITHK